MRPVPLGGLAAQEGGNIFCALRSTDLKKNLNRLNTNHGSGWTLPNHLFCSVENIHGLILLEEPGSDSVIKIGSRLIRIGF